MTDAVLPGATLGVLGSGQLGRMFAIAARRMGYRVHVLSPDTDTPTGQVADVEITAAYDDLDAVTTFAKSVEVVTFEFENVPQPTVEAARRFAPVRPSGLVLHTAQHRLREKTFLRDNGFPVTPFLPIRNESDLAGVTDLFLPGVLKTAAWGYDGKGQAKVETVEQVAHAWSNEFQQDAILERLVDFDKECSVIAARGRDGRTVCYDPVENIHQNHILDISLSPARLSKETTREATNIARSVLDQLDVVGVLCVEFFVTRDGGLLINELAPRPHNSGHLTMDAHVTCQFEQQVRAVCGLPLGSTRQLRPAAMVNLLGDLWSQSEPNWAAACSLPELKLHLYGKQKPRPGRKMGHLTATGETLEEAQTTVEQARLLASG